MSDNPSQYLFRPAAVDDLEAIVALVGSLTDSITTIPQNPEFILRRIQKSERSLHPSVDEPGDEQYFFVVEGPEGIVGTSAVIARVGGFQPFYTFELEDETFVHPPLKKETKMRVLTLKISHDGPSEIGSLYLRPDARGKGLARLLSLTRFHFIARFPQRFCDSLIAELRGYVDAEGNSPFWETVGKRFFDQEFSEADFLSGLGNKAFIRDLMPRHPLYVELLPQEAQSVIGEVHPHTRPARALLEQEGFGATREVDIFDAGPLLHARTNDIRTIRETRPFEVSDLKAPSELPKPSWIASNGELSFRACLAAAQLEGKQCLLSTTAAESLRVEPGDTIWLSALRPNLK